MTVSHGPALIASTNDPRSSQRENVAGIEAAAQVFVVDVVNSKLSRIPYSIQPSCDRKGATFLMSVAPKNHRFLTGAARKDFRFTYI